MICWNVPCYELVFKWKNIYILYILIMFTLLHLYVCMYTLVSSLTPVVKIFLNSHNTAALSRGLTVSQIYVKIREHWNEAKLWQISLLKAAVWTTCRKEPPLLSDTVLINVPNVILMIPTVFEQPRRFVCELVCSAITNSVFCFSARSVIEFTITGESRSLITVLADCNSCAAWRKQRIRQNGRALN